MRFQIVHAVDELVHAEMPVEVRIVTVEERAFRRDRPLPASDAVQREVELGVRQGAGLVLVESLERRPRGVAQSFRIAEASHHLYALLDDVLEMIREVLQGTPRGLVQGPGLREPRVVRHRRVMVRLKTHRAGRNAANPLGGALLFPFSD